MKFLKFLRALINDMFLIAGAAAIAAGAWMIYNPAGLIVGGLLVITYVVINCIGGAKHDQ